MSDAEAADRELRFLSVFIAIVCALALVIGACYRAGQLPQEPAAPLDGGGR